MAEHNTSGQVGSLERVWLGLVFGGPISAWLLMARVMRVRVEEAEGLDSLGDAERGARTAARWFPYGLTATAVGVTAFFMWVPQQTRFMERLMHVSFHAIAEDALASGAPFFAAIGAASLAIMSMGVIAGLLNASVFGALPLLVLRRSTSAAAPAVSFALARKSGSLEAEELAGYPRVALAVETILNRRRRLPGAGVDHGA